MKTQTRKRLGREISIRSFCAERQQSFGREVRHAAAETYLITRLSFELLRYLGVGYRWITKFLALGCYAMLLMPGFLQVAYYYFFSSQVRRSIVYGDQPRNRLDLYLPINNDGLKPVVIFITGGAWIIGYKAWGSLLGLQLAENDFIVACVDYRNFPQGTISDMVKDASQGISFVLNNIAEYGGDLNRIYLMGQSAGAHIAACALVEKAAHASAERENSWSASQIKAYFGISGGYNLCKLVDHFHARGLYRSIFLSIMEGEESLRRFSPEIVVQDHGLNNGVNSLPPIILLHGSEDVSIPSDASKTFADALRKVGVKTELIIYDGKTHTDLFLQDPLRGGTDQLLKDICTCIRRSEGAASTNEEEVMLPRRRLVPEFMIQLARKISPF
ncbi:isoprenylcysteine alpha-carbonyl methylesterase ICME-like isoform X1 [Papaver somniferum]|uniref:isoprenylcysteine alpha-carbonyl methylesterase ICME-like isoform X1 n=1 Tax=Papaver somniferum TaxID=3469 RepID=UPI000E70233C|nr:isoprenylcysteine alpha-carbonyl methylesterase ICME-like isoform X1 [Papaver somniferum]XP_026403001.1 isoprenylcysteine alpha-carbonyl methylesterase ICME-like isoform X1 [Papaver somniferum]